MNRNPYTINEINAQLARERAEKEKLLNDNSKLTLEQKDIAISRLDKVGETINEAAVKAEKALVEKFNEAAKESYNKEYNKIVRQARSISTGSSKQPVKARMTKAAKFNKTLSSYAVDKLGRSLERFYKKVAGGTALDVGKFEAMVNYVLRKNVAQARIKVVAKYIFKLLLLSNTKNVVGLSIVNPNNMVEISNGDYLNTIGIFNRNGYKDELFMAYLYFTVLNYYSAHRNQHYCFTKLESKNSINNFTLYNILFSLDVSLYDFMKQFDFDNKVLTRKIIRKEFKYNTNYLTVTFNPKQSS